MTFDGSSKEKRASLLGRSVDEIVMLGSWHAASLYQLKLLMPRHNEEMKLCC